MAIDGARISMVTALLVLCAGCPGDLAVRDAASDAAHDGAAHDGGRADAAGKDVGPDAQPCPPRAQLEGSYRGTFSGTLSGGLTAVMSGTVAFTLIKQGSDEFATIGGGKLEGMAGGVYPYTADLTGTVKCDQIDAKITNGKVMSVPFEGAMTGTWSNGAFSDGKWTGHDTGGSVQGGGSWTASKL